MKFEINVKSYIFGDKEITMYVSFFSFHGMMKPKVHMEVRHLSLNVL